MGLDSYFGRRVWSKEDNRYILQIADDLDWPDVNLCGGMFSGHGNGSFRGKVYANIVYDITGEDLYNSGLSMKNVAEGLRLYVDQHKRMKDEHIVDKEWEITFREVKDLAKVFDFALQEGLRYDAWYCEEEEKSYSCEEASDTLVQGYQFKINGDDTQAKEEPEKEIVTTAMDACKCPHCGGIFAVESHYLDYVEADVHCPICCMEVVIDN